MIDARHLPPKAIGIAWIRQQDYAACLRIFADGHRYRGGW